MELYVINDSGELPAEFLGQEYDPDIFVGDGMLQSFLEFVSLMYHNTLHTSQSHSCQGIDIVADKIHLHLKAVPGS